MIGRVCGLLSVRERRRGALVLGLVVVSALFEALGVASILPFLSVLGDGAGTQVSPWVTWLPERVHAGGLPPLALLAGLSFTLFIAAALLRTGTHYQLGRFAERQRSHIATRLLRAYLHAPYAFFLRRDSSGLASTLLAEVDEVVGRVLLPGLQVAAYGAVALALVSLLVVVDPRLALVVALVVGGIYLLLYAVVRGMNARNGDTRLAANRARYRSAIEALRGIRDIKLHARESVYLSHFSTPAEALAEAQARAYLIGQVPRFLVETAALGGILVLALWLSDGEGGATDWSLLGLYALAGYRLLPAVQNLYANITQMRFGRPALDAVVRAFAESGPASPAATAGPRRSQAFRELRCEQLCFRYPGGDADVLRGVDLDIRCGEFLGIAGETGCGKSTLLDCLLGLLTPDSGIIRVNGDALHADDAVAAWQASVGYVSQDIFIADASVADNTAFPEGGET
ncbi:MAG: ABC transporter ATP-binding protein, partial [Oceanococcaceae bacterium]